MENIRLKVKFLVLLVFLLVAAVAANLAWTSHTQQVQMENELREKGQVLSLQMKATWNFMAENQDRFEATAYSPTGSYQGLHCALAGRTIGKLFTMESDYTTRYVNFNPRNAEDEPDEFEAEALNAFYSDPNVTEYYAVTEYEGQEAYRYLSAMTVQDACLDCHGSPKGELDVTGHEKEGWQTGDVGGALSIVIPMDIYRQAEKQNIQNSVLFFVILLLALLIIVWIALSWLVTKPLAHIRGGVERVQTGELDVALPLTAASQEMNGLVSEFNKMTHELSDLYAGLESQVADRTAQLERANEILEQQQQQLQQVNEQLVADNQYKTDFLNMMSHELRTPLTSIIAFSDMLNKEGGDLSEKELETRREIEANSRVLLLMINDILEMSRLDAGRTSLDVEPVDMYDLLGLVHSVVAPLARQNGIELTFDIDPHTPMVQGDFEKLRHALENLAGNAVKFTPAGGHIHMQAGYCPDERMVRIDVCDDGIGIAEKDQERIFERFTQADSSVSRKYNGTGLGLPLAREYVEMHGGTLTVDSRLGEGSTFTVKLPEEIEKGSAE